MSCRRATADTLAPGAKLSATIAAFTSVDQRRRRPVPVTISTRRSVSAPCSRLGVCLSLSLSLRLSFEIVTSRQTIPRDLLADQISR